MSGIDFDTSISSLKEYVELLENKSANVLLQIICKVIRLGFIIYMDKRILYQRIFEFNHYNHATFCHRYNFVNQETNLHMHSLEIFGNEIEIKRDKEI